MAAKRLKMLSQWSVLCLISCVCNMGCSTDKGGSPLSLNAERQQTSANQLADDYIVCIKQIDDQSARESFADKNTRREMVLESCSEFSNRFTIVQEQAYSNACLASGKDMKSCDTQAVSHARRETQVLQQQASQRIDRTSASGNYRTPNRMNVAP